MERDILSVLNFDIFSVSSYQFFSFFYLASNLDNKILFCLGHLILILFRSSYTRIMLVKY